MAFGSTPQPSRSTLTAAAQPGGSVFPRPPAQRISRRYSTGAPPRERLILHEKA